ncbi:hypothetical protein KUL118_21460 [Tenacibaculum sp. KUL118]|uniref:hypothetical protein n=1 Tax=Tenacibaculum sp. XPcli2-G TaxID=2954503 RepID=UPI0012E5F50F|nr:hypothetical protein [Tenacibaculum sp. XPcli2-G]MCO7186433.1 hypothetical protein [Tenacibaculum sp. XPcli2-G]GFD79284.1 hypothetical protein KUL118_21460 [Tenacibaculum sp. KUL118]
MRTLKFTLLISTLFLLTTSCTDLTEDIVPNNTVDNIELILDDGSTDKTDPPGDRDTGGGNDGGDGTKGN